MALFGDIRFGLRSLAKTPTSTLAAIAALSLGLGANAVVFSIAYGALFRNLPFISDNILYLHSQNAKTGERMGVSAPDFRDWSAQSKSFQGMGAYSFESINLSDQDSSPERFQMARVTGNTFSITGQKPVLGRDFSAEDANPGSPAVVVLGDRIWQTRYGANRGVLGKAIRINGSLATVIGVMRPGFIFPIESDLWMPLSISGGDKKRGDRPLAVFGALAPGATRESAAAEMAVITGNLAAAFPDTNRDTTALVRTFSEENNDSDDFAVVGALMGSVIFVLLIACANVANLLLARSADRTREISVRVALGAGRWNILRQLLVESVMLSSVSGVLGCLFAVIGLHFFVNYIRGNIPAWMDMRMDYHALAYLAAISVGTGLLFGLAPAFRLASLNVNASLREGGRGSSGSRRSRHLSAALVVVEMALALVLLSGAGLMIRSVYNIRKADTGVNAQNVLVMRLDLPLTKYPKPEDQIAFHRQLKGRLESLPGVVSTAIASYMPTGGSSSYPYELEGDAPADLKHRPRLSAVIIGPNYFRVMGVPAPRGREFTEQDGATGPPVVLVNERFAQKIWPGQNPIGKRLHVLGDRGLKDWVTVIGVAPNILQNSIAMREPDPLLYIPYREIPLDDVALMARTSVPPRTQIAAFRRETQQVDGDLPLYSIRTLEDRLARNDWEHTIMATLLSIFAGIALALAALGLYAVIAHSVSQRTQEIGVRMALGASAGDILRGVFAQGITQLAIGLTLGALAAIGVTRFLSSMLVLVTATDPATFVAVGLVLGAAAVLGCLIPARRAVSVDPATALRYE